MINCRFSTFLATGVDIEVVAAGLPLLSVVSMLLLLGVPALFDGVAAPGVAGVDVRPRLLAEKARCSRAAVVDRFRIKPFIFYLKKRGKRKEQHKEKLKRS